MNILFISPHVLWGGASIANITIAKMLLDSCYNVIYNDEYFPADVYNGVKVDHTAYHSNKRLYKKQFVNDIIAMKIDIVIWDSSMTMFYYPEILKLKKKGVKHISILHSLSLNQNIKGRLIETINSFTLSIMDAIVYVSNFTLSSWDKHYFINKSKAIKQVIYNSINRVLCIPKHQITSKHVRLGFVGRFSEEKQPEIFCRLSTQKEYELHAFGDGPLFESTKKQYPDVIYHGLEKNQDKIYSCIDILVITSKFENCPMVVLEAMVRGIPVVAPRVGGIPELVKNNNNGMLYESYEQESILYCINAVTDNYSNYSANCKAKSQFYYCDNITNDWNLLINKLNNKQ